MQLGCSGYPCGYIPGLAIEWLAGPVGKTGWQYRLARPVASKTWWQDRLARLVGKTGGMTSWQDQQDGQDRVLT